ncbi:hypothetical protein CXK94_18405 [Stutzerimonas stutzeri]|uniref:DUF748 domain-containing protein n=1 Tax=Stutzerimonas stutzeri TaxID=316 RepID=A0A2N8SVJ1_STUST|nr:DUF748 domain-containing protein [Stutzerimonas stutzeri]MCQ4325726.1 DUF748 domain-containing protein [Stutzerimonas stutzeri]PNG06469.1 hypothetical protein CXK94_18405 [Stutzerimonas stutzeri]
MPNGMKRALSGVALALIFYCLLGFLILPGALQRIANQQLAAYATVPASLERIEFNPFSLELDLFELHIGEADDRQLAFEQLYLNLQWDSLWQRTLHLAAVELTAPRSEVRFADDGVLNLGRLFELPEAEEPEPAQESGLFPLRIDRLQLARGYLHFQDRRPSEPIDLVYDALDFELHNLTTRADDSADASLAASGPGGGRIDWQGQFSLQPLASHGRLKVSKLALTDFRPYIRDAAPLVLEGGSLDLSTDYRLDLSQGLALDLHNATLTLAALAVDSPQGRPLVRLEQLVLGETSVDLLGQQVSIGTLRSRNLETWAAREADGELDWQKLFATAGSTPEAPTEGSPAAEQDEPGKPWQVFLHDAQLRDYHVHLADRVPQDEVALELGPLNLDVADFDSLGTSPFKLKLESGVGRQGALQATGQLQLSPMSGKLAVTTRDIDLRIAQAYISPLVRLELRSGMLSSELDVELQGTEPLAFSVRGQAEATQLHTLDTLNNRDFVKWQRLQLSGLDYQHPSRLEIERIDLNQPYARFIINPDLSTNINDLMVDRGEPTEEPAATQAQPLALRIGGIAIADGSANFADFSLRPPFATAIQSLNGSIGTLDNREQKAASVDIAGKVDQYAPVSIKGSLTPFDPLQSLDIATRFRQVELTTLTPYSGKFAGYRIRKGRLDLDLHYRIQQGQLNAENKVVVEQLQLGEKVDSPDAVDLPVRLAVALLKDTKGTISIELPVQGNLNDPQFSVMPIIWQTLRNLVLRAAQAPFKFIAGLVGGDQVDLSQVRFAPASSELDGEARQALDTLVSALQQRPALQLEVEGMSASAADGPLLAERRLQQEYRETWYRILQRRGDKVPADASQIQIDEDDEAPLLEGIYRSRLKQQPPAEWRELEPEERTQRLRQAVVDSWAGNTALLRRLSQQRAAAIKDHLVQAGLDAERIYLLDTGTAEAEPDGKVATMLHLGS